MAERVQKGEESLLGAGFVGDPGIDVHEHPLMFRVAAVHLELPNLLLRQGHQLDERHPRFANLRKSDLAEMNGLSRQIGRLPIDLVQPVFLVILASLASLQCRKRSVSRESDVDRFGPFEGFLIDADVDSMPAGAVQGIGNLRSSTVVHGQQQSAGEGPAGIGRLPKRVANRLDVNGLSIPFGGVVDNAPGTMFPLPGKGGLGLRPVQVAQIDGFRRFGFQLFRSRRGRGTVVSGLRTGRDQNKRHDRQESVP